LLEIVKQVPGIEKPSSLSNISLGAHLHFQVIKENLIVKQLISELKVFIKVKIVFTYIIDIKTSTTTKNK
jgi:hypothetical protein